jgi:hypothetical protein
MKIIRKYQFIVIKPVMKSTMVSVFHPFPKKLFYGLLSLSLACDSLLFSTGECERCKTGYTIDVKGQCAGPFAETSIMPLRIIATLRAQIVTRIIGLTITLIRLDDFQAYSEYKKHALDLQFSKVLRTLRSYLLHLITVQSG